MNGNSVASPLGSNTARGKNVLNNVIVEVFHDNAGAKAKKKTNPKSNGAPKNLTSALGYKEALMSPPSDKENTNIVGKRLAKKLTPLPVKESLVYKSATGIVSSNCSVSKQTSSLGGGCS
nr:hypothetical protein Iba_chr01bCG9040 [Ipomoea batatas]GMC55421.1 hypothetical protein Iba_chr01eCG7290 [Ipomoea batatas]